MNREYPTIAWHLYPDETTKIQVTGEDGYAETNRETFEVFSVYNDEINPLGPHELVHLLTNFMGVSNLVLSEGLAEYFEDTWKIDGVKLGHDDWVRKFVRDKTYLPISRLFDDFLFWELDPDGSIAYAESGSFAKFLIAKYGIEKFLQAYQSVRRRGADNFEKFEAAYRRSINDIEQEWLDSLNS